MVKRVIAIFLCIATCISFAACSSDSKDTASDKSAAKSTLTEGTAKAPESNKLFKEKVTLKMMIHDNASWPYKEDWYIKKALEEKCNLSFDVVVVDGKQYSEKFNLVMASGDAPDIIQNYSTTDVNKYALQGAFVNALENLDKTPNFKAWKESNEEKIMQFTASDGNLYNYPSYGLGITNRRLWFYRKDILDKNGLKLPSGEQEFYSLLKKLKELYPDSYPFGYRNAADWLELIAPSWGTSETAYLDFSTNKWAYGPIEDNYKKMVSFLSKLYKEELLPSDLYSINSKAWVDLMAQGKIFITCDYVGRIDTLTKAGKEITPEFELAFMPPVGGKMGFTAVDYANSVIPKKSSKVNEAMKFIDWLYTDEAKELVSWGEEGKTFEVKDGKRKFLDVDYRKAYGLTTGLWSTILDTSAIMSTYPEACINASSEAVKYEMKANPVYYMPLSEQEAETAATIGQNIKKYKDEMTSLFILGQKSLDEWDSYVSEIKKMQLDKLMETYDTAYKRQSKK